MNGCSPFQKKTGWWKKVQHIILTTCNNLPKQLKTIYAQDRNYATPTTLLKHPYLYSFEKEGSAWVWHPNFHTVILQIFGALKFRWRTIAERSVCNIPNFDSNHSDTFFLVLVFLQSRHKQIPKKHHINTVSTSHISHTHITFTRNAADHNITQSVLTRRHLCQSIVRAGKMLSITRCSLNFGVSGCCHDRSMCFSYLVVFFISVRDHITKFVIRFQT